MREVLKYWFKGEDWIFIGHCCILEFWLVPVYIFTHRLGEKLISIYMCSQNSVPIFQNPD